MISKYINSGSFALILLCFLMPFISIKCNDTTLVTFKGKDFVTGTQYKLDNNPFGKHKTADETGIENEAGDTTLNEDKEEKDENRMEPNILMIIILAAGALGLLLSLVLTLHNSTAAISSAALVLICLVIFMVQLQKEVGKQSTGTDPMLTDKIKIYVSYDMGFWLMAIAAAGIIGYNIYFLSRRKTADIGPII